MKKLEMFFLVFFMSIAFTSGALALPPAAEADRLQLHGVDAFKAGDFATAVEDFSKLEAMHIEGLQESFPYHYGVALANLKKYDSAKEKLEAYIGLGSDTKFYKEALKTYNVIIDAQKAQALERQQLQDRVSRKRQEDIEKYNRELAAYNAEVASYDSRVAQMKLREAKDIDNCRHCQNSCEKSHGGFFGSAVALQKCYGDCSTIKSCVDRSYYVPAPVPPVRPQ